MEKDEVTVASARFVVDKTVHAVIETSTRTTPSNEDGISAQVERTHRLHGASILHDACQILKLPSSVFATACTLFHRMYHRISLRNALRLERCTGLHTPGLEGRRGAAAGPDNNRGVRSHLSQTQAEIR